MSTPTENTPSSIANDRKPIPVKLVLLGESAVGKSSLALRFVNREYTDNKEPTIGAAFLTQKCTVDDERTIKFEIWDTAGQERFHSLAPMYYRNAQAAIVVYDVTKASTLDKAKGWVKELQRQANSQIVIALVGNKVDLVEDEQDDAVSRQVTFDEAQAYASESSLLFFETSAKNALNVDSVFIEIAKNIPRDHLMNNRLNGNSENTRVELLRDGSANGKGSGSCAC
ncbi:hypothetical protein BY458DRAFT_543584 [Sporodiniella umbellata]|nr:hypothetical protein BY458DRAFT_543584 [Sporodiniella umbellata]